MKKILAVFMSVIISVTFIPAIAFATEDNIQPDVNNLIDENDNPPYDEDGMDDSERTIIVYSSKYYDDDDITYIYDSECDYDSVKGLSYNPETNVLTMEGYSGGPIEISGLDGININVKKASTIKTPTKIADEDTAGWGGALLDMDCNVKITGSAKLTLSPGKYKYEEYDEDEEKFYFDSTYSDGIYVEGNLELDGSNIAISKANIGVTTNGFEMKGGTLKCSGSFDSALSAFSKPDIHGGTISNGYSIQMLETEDLETPDMPIGFDGDTYEYVIGKKGADYTDNDDESDHCYNSKVARTVTVKGGNTFYGTYGDFNWTINNKGVLTITGKGVLKKIESEGEEENKTVELEWNNYSNRISSIVLGEGITKIDNGILNELKQATSVSVPASIDDLYEDTFDGMIKLSAVNVNSQNSNYFSKSGVLFYYSSDDKSTVLEYYPEGKKAANYSIPEGVKTLNDCSFEGATVKTLTLPKTLYDIDDAAISDAKISAIKVAKGNPNYSVNKNNLYRTAGTSTKLIWYSPANKDRVFNIPEGVTDIVNNAFVQNDKLMSVYVPATVRNIDVHAFESNRKLDVLFMGDAPEAGSNLSDATYIYQEGTSNWGRDCWSEVTLISCKDIKEYYPSEIAFGEKEYVVNLNSEEKLELDVDWNPSEAHLTSLEYSCSDKAGLDLETDGVNVSIKPLKAGTFTLTATAPTGINCKCQIVVQPYFMNGEEAEIYVGDTYKNSLVGTSSGVTWKSSDKKVAKVTSKGVVTGVKEGDCIITATFKKRTYKYEINVSREYPGSQKVSVDYYDYDNNRFSISVSNEGDHDFVVYSSGAKLFDDDYFDYGETFWNRKLKLSKSSIKIEPGETKVIYFKVDGKKLYYFDEDDEWCEYDSTSANIYCTIQINGKKYSACFYENGGEFQYPGDDNWYLLYQSDDDDDDDE